jgi:hypothetical protein
MITLRKAAQQALEALEAGGDSWRLIGPAIDALRAALEQPEQMNYFEVQRIAKERGLDYNKFAAALRAYLDARAIEAALKERNA